MKQNGIGRTEPVNTKLIIGGMALFFLIRQAGVNQAWEADKIRNYG